VGVIYRNSRPPFEDHIATLKKGPLVAQTVDRARLAKVMETYG
jgi:hypothetical protein